MDRDTLACHAFGRAAALFPSSMVELETAQGTLTPDGFCVTSFDPPIVAITFSIHDGGPPEPEFSISAVSSGQDKPIARLDCQLLETKEVGDHRMLFCAVQGAKIGGGTPLVRWRRAIFDLRLSYPFLESEEILEAFVSGWLSGDLPAKAWTHAAHVGVTGYYAFDRDPESVFVQMKLGIAHFNTCKGGVNGPDSGYHETLTRFWTMRITSSVSERQPESRIEAARYAVRYFGEDRDLPSLYYSFDVVRDRQARREWVAPDLEPLPEWCGDWAVKSERAAMI